MVRISVIERRKHVKYQKLNTPNSIPAKRSAGSREHARENTWIPTICWLCNRGPDLIRVQRINGVVANLEGNTEGPGFVELTKSRGRICLRPYGFIQKLYNPYRIKGPLKRTNPQKGIGIDPKWVEISWDEALDTISEKLRGIRADDARKACFITGGPNVYSNVGTWPVFSKAFGNAQSLGSGSSVRCDLSEHIFGNHIHAGWCCEPDAIYCNYLILMGRNPRASGGIGENVQYTDAQLRGMKMIVIDPVFSETAAKADEWLPIKPGTDLALQLALINVILNEIGIIDKDFLKNLTNSPYLVGQDGYFVRDVRTNKVLVWDSVERRGKTYDDNSIQDFALDGTYVVDGVECRPAFQVLKEHISQYTPEWASSITEISAATIRRIAKEWVDNARIGSTIQIGRVSLPYRPVAMKVGRGLTGNMRSYQGMLCEHILSAIVGALETVGGHGGGIANPEELGASAPPYRGIIPGPDGMLKLDTHSFTWPPVSYQMNETLLPYSKVMPGPLFHLAYRHLADLPTDIPLPPVPDIAIKLRANPVLSIGEPELVAKALCRIPCLVSIAYTRDETTELADIVLPDHTEFERYELVTMSRRALAKNFKAISLRQPVVEPLHNTKDISDIMTELADRAGFLDDYNMAVNSTLSLSEAYKLETDKKYSWVDIVDRQCKSVTKGAHDLEWFKINAAIVEPVRPELQYSVHQEMVAKKLRYPIPYMEHVKKTGHELAQNLTRVGIDWWPTSEYVPLPIYVPSILEEVSPEYDFYVTISRSLETAYSANTDSPWLIEVGQHDLHQQGIVMNKGAAKVKGIKDGDEIWVESEVGKVKGKVKLIEGIRPDTVLITGQSGQWSTPIAKDTGKVSQSVLVPIRPSWIDPVVGCMQGNTVKAKVYKA
jgi:phenylacetyl-CoA:acceptor oxidoreductase